MDQTAARARPARTKNGRLDKYLTSPEHPAKVPKTEPRPELDLPEGATAVVLNKPDFVKKFISLLKEDTLTLDLGADHLHAEVSMYYGIALVVAKWCFGAGLLSEPLQQGCAPRSFTFRTKTLERALAPYSAAKYQRCVLAFGADGLSVYYWNKRHAQHCLSVHVDMVDTPADEARDVFDPDHSGELGLEHQFAFGVDVRQFREDMAFKSGKTKEEKSKNGGNNRVNVLLEPAGRAGGGHNLAFVYKDTQMSARLNYRIPREAVVSCAAELASSVLARDYSEEMVAVLLSFLELLAGAPAHLYLDRELPMQASAREPGGSYLVLLIGAMSDPT